MRGSNPRSSENLLFIMAILLFALLVFANSGSAHDPSEESGDAQMHHQLPPPWPFHLLFVSVGGVSLIGGAFTARYLRQRDGWFALHKKLALTGVASILVGVSVAVYMVTTYMETYFVKELHTYLGASVFTFVILTPALGFAQLRSSDKRVRIAHRWSGRIIIILILIAIFAGVQMAAMVLSGG